MGKLAQDKVLGRQSTRKVGHLSFVSGHRVPRDRFSRASEGAVPILTLVDVATACMGYSSTTSLPSQSDASTTLPRLHNEELADQWAGRLDELSLPQLELASALVPR